MPDQGRAHWESHWPDDASLLERAVNNLPREGRARWATAMDRFGVGSSVAQALCARFNLDPDEILKRYRG